MNTISFALVINSFLLFSSVIAASRARRGVGTKRDKTRTLTQTKPQQLQSQPQPVLGLKPIPLISSKINQYIIDEVCQNVLDKSPSECYKHMEKFQTTDTHEFLLKEFPDQIINELMMDKGQLLDGMMLMAKLFTEPHQSTKEVSLKALSNDEFSKNFDAEVNSVANKIGAYDLCPESKVTNSLEQRSILSYNQVLYLLSYLLSRNLFSTEKKKKMSPTASLIKEDIKKNIIEKCIRISMEVQNTYWLFCIKSPFINVPKDISVYRITDFQAISLIFAPQVMKSRMNSDILNVEIVVNDDNEKGEEDKGNLLEVSDDNNFPIISDFKLDIEKYYFVTAADRTLIRTNVIDFIIGRYLYLERRLLDNSLDLHNVTEAQLKQYIGHSDYHQCLLEVITSECSRKPLCDRMGHLTPIEWNFLRIYAFSLSHDRTLDLDFRSCGDFEKDLLLHKQKLIILKRYLSRIPMCYLYNCLWNAHYELFSAILDTKYLQDDKIPFLTPLKGFYYNLATTSINLNGISLRRSKEVQSLKKEWPPLIELSMQQAKLITIQTWAKLKIEYQTSSHFNDPKWGTSNFLIFKGIIGPSMDFLTRIIDKRGVYHHPEGKNEEEDDWRKLMDFRSNILGHYLEWTTSLYFLDASKLENSNSTSPEIPINYMYQRIVLVENLLARLYFLYNNMLIHQQQQPNPTKNRNNSSSISSNSKGVRMMKSKEMNSALASYLDWKSLLFNNLRLDIISYCATLTPEAFSKSVQEIQILLDSYDGFCLIQGFLPFKAMESTRKQLQLIK